MDNDNDDESIGNTIKGTNVSQLGYSERSVQEDNAFMAAADLGYSGIFLNLFLRGETVPVRCTAHLEDNISPSAPLSLSGALPSVTTSMTSVPI